MKAHTSEFKEQIRTLGRELDVIVTFNGVELRNEQLNSLTPHYEGGLLKSVMKQLDIDSNVEINVGNVVNYKLGIKVNDEYEYLNFGDYIVNKVEKQEDFNSYMITCYDKMLYSMKDYGKLNISYPISIRDYITAICNHLGINFKNKNETFANYDKMIQNELYLDENDNSLGYTFRDVFDELAQATASTICINDNDELEIRYINDTQDTIDEEFLKDINVVFGKKYGPINSIVLSRSAGSDNVYLRDEASVSENGLTELKISDNQIMNWNDRSDYLPDILEKINGLEYYLNDFVSTGVCYYDLCDKYNVQIGDNIYSCIMLNDEINITQGLVEQIYTEELETSETDYTKSDKTDIKINKTNLIVDKQNGVIQGIVEKQEQIEVETTLTKEANGNPIIVEDAGPYDLESIEIDGKSIQDGTPTPDAPIEIKNVEGVTNLLNCELETTTYNGVTATYDKTDKTITLNGTCTKDNTCFAFPKSHDLILNGEYTLSYEVVSGSISNVSDKISIQLQNNSTWDGIQLLLKNSQKYLTKTLENLNVNTNNIRVDNGVICDNFKIKIQLVKGSKINNIVPFGRWLEVKTNTRNIYDATINETGSDLIYSADKEKIYLNGIGNSNKVNFKPQFFKKGTYTLCCEMISGDLVGSLLMYMYNRGTWTRPSMNELIITDTNKQSYTTFILEEDIELELGVFTMTENKYTNLQVKYQIVEGDEPNFDFGISKEKTALVDLKKKNWFDKDNVELINGYVHLDGTIHETNEWLSTATYIKVKPNTKYIIDADNMGTRFLYMEYFEQKQASIIGERKEITPKTSFTTSNTTEYIRFSTNNPNNTDFKIYEGVEIDDYYSFKENDTFKDGLYTQKRAKIVLDGSADEILNGIEEYNSGSTSTKGVFSFTIPNEVKLMTHFTNANLTSCDNKLAFDNLEDGQFNTRTGTIDRVYFRISSITSVADLRTWLSENPVTIEYELAEPIEHTLNYEVLELHEGYNNITTNDDLEPNMSITYLTDSKLNAQYATKAELDISNKEISLKVDAKIDDKDLTSAEIIARINDDKESEAVINADKISLEGKEINMTSDDIIIESDNLKIDKYGKIKIINDESENPEENASFKVTNRDETTKHFILDGLELIMSESDTDVSLYQNATELNVIQEVAQVFGSENPEIIKDYMVHDSSNDTNYFYNFSLGKNNQGISFTDFANNKTSEFGIGKLIIDNIDILGALFYKPGDVYTPYRAMATNGFLTDGATNIFLSFVLPKSMVNVTPTVTSLKLTVRHPDGGYLLNAVEVFDDSTLSITETYKSNDNVLQLRIAKTTAFNFTNNVPLSISIDNITVKFS